VASMLFFQLLLLAGYAYSYVISISLPRPAQSVVHGLLVLAGLATMTMQFRVWETSSPSLSILGTLLLSIGLPYFLLSATSPLLQSWLGGSSPAPFPWWLFALSNAASLAALLAYPAVIEASPLVDRLRRLRSAHPCGRGHAASGRVPRFRLRSRQFADPDRACGLRVGALDVCRESPQPGGRPGAVSLGIAAERLSAELHSVLRRTRLVSARAV